MTRVVVISVRDHDRQRRPAHRHDDDKQIKQIPGWAAERIPKDEPPIANKNLALGRWVDRASANSGPKIAPGCGTTA
jgi:hypothetical protein